jgi:hypothetical protein
MVSQIRIRVLEKMRTTIHKCKVTIRNSKKTANMEVHQIKIKVRAT